ncbi:MAG TPA: hypothetical protein VHH34_15420, partial [Pseudonocardiaceae bacterium]|nr:hypothetical protein [Pseudonocardiaceae bacterium]
AWTPVPAGVHAMSNRSSPCAGKKGVDMEHGSCRDQAWVQLIREIIASWRLLLGAAVLVLVCTPAVVALAVVILAGR